MDEEVKSTDYRRLWYVYLVAGFLFGISVAYLYLENQVVTTTTSTTTTTGSPESQGCCITSMPGTDNSFGIIAPETAYWAAVANYKVAHPDVPGGRVTWGGHIGKIYLQAIINSLGTDPTVNFSFADDETCGKQSIYFVGGNFDPVCGVNPSKERLFVRTGNVEGAFCPTHCDVR